MPLSPEFAEGPTKQTQWTAFLRRGKLDGLQQEFAQVIAALRQFLLPVAEAIAIGSSFSGTWTAPGPWQV